MARREGVPRVAVHAFLDGRDTPPRSAEASLLALQALCDRLGNARIASVDELPALLDAWDLAIETQAASAAG